MYDVLKVVNWLRVRNNADLKLDPNTDELTQMKAMSFCTTFKPLVWL